MPTHCITISNRNTEFQCAEDEALLGGMEQRRKQGIRVGCRGGGCGICKIRVLEGLYHHKRMSASHVDASERTAGFALACRVFPQSDMVIEADHFVPPKKACGQTTAADFAAPSRATPYVPEGDVKQ